ncbi:c-type cytochrome biogenesis protein CcmI [Psychromonas aquimarina]|uniref:c-type cytochrome biogenesis protein CcmI n=1 Tax=Psychromonas aquimarina TaxID=444919 RepID=UPI000406D1F5|nr:c-type cytochrome biogenesis protein CcmI [Psychromonas aquimarina]
MILQFWLAAVLLLIIAGAVFVLPFLREKNKAQADAASRNQLNKSLYEVRLAELEQDEAQGLLVDKAKIVTELQHNLLDDTSEQLPAAAVKKSSWIWLPGLVVLVFGSLSLYWSVGAYQQTAQWQDVLQRYPALQNKLFNDRSSQPSEQDLRDIMLGLRTQLAADENDADGWLLYSRLAMVFKDGELALNAVKKAHQLDPESLDIRLVYIQLKMQMGDEYSQNQAEVMLMKVLQDYPNELEAWSMYAFMALEKQDYISAVERWKKMLTLIDPESEQAAILQDSIAYAHKQINGASVESDAVQAHKAMPTAKVEKTIQAVGQTYQVQISVDKKVTVPENGFLFVFAQSAGGPAMPIAALKMNISSFPVTVELSDANSMMEGVKLSDYPEFIIKARISSDSNVNSKADRWQGESPVIKAGQETDIKLLISQQL